MKNSLNSLSQKFIGLTQKVPLQVLVFGQTLLIVLLIVLVPAIFLTIKNSRNNDSQASTPTGTAVISLSPTSTQLGPNVKHNVDVLVNTGTEKVDGIQAVTLFTGTVPSDLTFAPNTVPGLNNIVNTTDTITNGRKISFAFITTNPQQPFSTNSSLVKVGTFSFTAPATGNMNVVFDEQSTIAIKNGTAEDILKTPASNTYAFAIGQNPSEPSLAFNTLTPPNPQQVGSNFQVNIVADTAGQKVSGVDAQITFDPSLVEIISIQQGTGTPFPSYPELTYDNTAGKIFVSANIGTSSSPTPVNASDVQVAKITGRTKAATSSTTLRFVFNPNDRNDSNLSLYLDQQGQEPADILAKVSHQELIAVNPNNSPTPGPTSTPVPTATLQPTATPIPTATPVAAVTSTLQFSMQGKNRNDASKAAQIAFAAKSVDNTQNVSSTITTNASGQAQVALVPNNYVILVKTPGYLAKKIGSTSAPIHITADGSPVNLSSTPLLGGDFNGDGEINSIDYTLHFLTSLRNSNAVVDLDSSGTVNNLDFAIMRSNWASRSDTL